MAAGNRGGPQQGKVEKGRACRTEEGAPVIAVAAFSSNADPVVKCKLARFFLLA